MYESETSETTQTETDTLRDDQEISITSSVLLVNQFENAAASAINNENIENNLAISATFTESKDCNDDQDSNFTKRTLGNLRVEETNIKIGDQVADRHTDTSLPAILFAEDQEKN